MHMYVHIHAGSTGLFEEPPQAASESRQRLPELSWQRYLIFHKKNSYMKNRKISDDKLGSGEIQSKSLH